MAKRIGFFFVNKSLSLVIDGKVHDISQQHPRYKEIVDTLKSSDMAEDDRVTKLSALIQHSASAKMAAAVQAVGVADITVDHGVVRVRGAVMRTSLTQRILDLAAAGLPTEGFIAFLANLCNNPSEESRDSLFDFLEQGHFPLTDDGCFLGYKGVKHGNLNGKDTLVDYHSASFDMSPGNVHEMPWDAVDNNRNSACGAGFHVGTLAHARSFMGYDGVMIVVKVNPADCVSVPKYDTTKLRCRKYEVVNVYKDEPTELPRPMYTKAEYMAPDFTTTAVIEQKQKEEGKLAAATAVKDFSTFTRDEIVREAITLGLARSVNEARMLGRDMLVTACTNGKLPFEDMDRDLLAALCVRRHLFTSERAALKAGKTVMIASLAGKRV